tara:strand:- start:99 stop:1397 length:1299 start_codon:yes stop_codon:yes gene_type:complete
MSNTNTVDIQQIPTWCQNKCHAEGGRHDSDESGCRQLGMGECNGAWACVYGNLEDGSCHLSQGNTCIWVNGECLMAGGQRPVANCPTDSCENTVEDAQEPTSGDNDNLLDDYTDDSGNIVDNSVAVSEGSEQEVTIENCINANRMESIMETCCGPDGCPNDGMPDTCTPSCAEAYTTFWEECRGPIQEYDDNTYGVFSTFATLCENPTESSLLDPVPEGRTRIQLSSSGVTLEYPNNYESLTNILIIPNMDENMLKAYGEDSTQIHGCKGENPVKQENCNSTQSRESGCIYKELSLSIGPNDNMMEKKIKNDLLEISLFTDSQKIKFLSNERKCKVPYENYYIHNDSSVKLCLDNTTSLEDVNGYCKKWDKEREDNEGMSIFLIVGIVITVLFFIVILIAIISSSGSKTPSTTVASTVPSTTIPQPVQYNTM